MSQFVADRSRRAVATHPDSAVSASTANGAVSWIQRTEVRMVNIGIITLWLGLEAGHAWRRLKAWLDWMD